MYPSWTLLHRSNSTPGPYLLIIVNYHFFFSICYFMFLAAPWDLGDLNSQTRDWTQATVMKAPSPKHWTTRNLPLFICLFLVVLGLHCYVQGFSMCAEQGYALVVGWKLLIAVASRCGAEVLGLLIVVASRCGAEVLGLLIAVASRCGAEVLWGESFSLRWLLVAGQKFQAHRLGNCRAQT